MRRPGQYADPGANVYVAGQMQHVSSQRMENRSESDHFQGRLEAFTPEREHPYVTSKPDGQWRWERDESKMAIPLASQMYNEGQGLDASRSHFQGKGQPPEQKLALEKQGMSDPRFGHHEEDVQIGFEDKTMLQTFESVEQIFFENLTNLVKEHNDAEDAENSRHREVNAINTQYQEQLAALRTQHASRRDEFLRKESLVRQHQYQQTVMDRSGMGSSGYMGNTPSTVTNEAHRAYNNDSFESYRDRDRDRQFLGGSRDQGFEPRSAYQGGRVYDTSTRYY
ncbi:uncharacterized protein [Euphorbia lathyris]|uniref:uncharacterized protein isoform X2 n=1 Tax=Euphorbia lathyris TaxID=212925 RepID=UPI0033132875